ncbi:hypothetical protein F0919_09240 [Taibaiella lutea]|uniref:Uncharacterized protein n=1 Tax=Taibaiella lutea TaxID=2608001 RepID=A0A5M6CLB8_9BACT|nr:hypothetical protein [Taibaiella lutea]KAA5534782.1 hypothetical protein F0919_09240 [Taibaiella lutea]
MVNRSPKYVMNQVEKQFPSTGHILSEVIKKRKINIAALARILQRRYSTVRFYFKNDSIQTAILWEISLILKHNFFADIAAQLPPDFAGGTKSEVLAARDAEIAELKQTVARLQGEKDLLMQVMKNK